MARGRWFDHGDSAMMAAAAETPVLEAAVIEAEAPKPEEAATLDELLAEFEKSTVNAKSAEIERRLAPYRLSPEAEAMNEAARKVIDTAETERLAREAEKLVGAAREALGVGDHVDDDVLRGLLRGILADDPEAKPAFVNALADPEAWATVWDRSLKALDKLVKKLKPIRVTSDAERAAAAVRNLTPGPPPKAKLPPPEFVVGSAQRPDRRRMNDAEFEAYRRKFAGGEYE